MTEHEHNTLIQMIRKKFGTEVPEDFDLSLYEHVDYPEVTECAEKENSFEDFEYCLTTRYYRNANVT